MIIEKILALLLRPDYPSYLFGRGNAYLLMEDYDRAIADYEAILRIEPHNIDARKNMIWLAGKKRSFKIYVLALRNSLPYRVSLPESSY